MGPEAAKFFERKAAIAKALEECYKQQEELYSQLRPLQETIKHLNNLIHVTRKRLTDEQAALTETRDRTKQLNELNQKVEQKINSIQVTIPKTNTTTTRRNSGWWWWRTHSSTKETTETKVLNTNREVEKAYYESMLLRRVAQIRENRSAEEAKEEITTGLESDICLYEKDLEMARKELETFIKRFPDEMTRIQNDIIKYDVELVDINKEATAITKKVGHSGAALIDCLVRIQAIKESSHGANFLYMPIVHILQAVKSSTTAATTLLMSNEKADVYIAGKRLLRQAGSLSSYASFTNNFLQLSSQFHALESAPEHKAIL
ncbi:unnamed protein product [Rotaria socialis]|nr:unnamed protein product [Rotaria socialis]